MTSVRDVIRALDALFPPGLAEDWDRVGLQVGSPDGEARGVAVALEATVRTVEETDASGANVLVTHHPLLFKAPERIDTGDPILGAVIAEAIRRDVTVVAAHTNADWARGGLNDRLAEQMGLRGVRPLEARSAQERVKIVTFVPRDHVDAVASAMFREGAGVIGDYSCCSFRLDGTGSFFPEAGATPFSGTKGALSLEPETRLEMLADADRLDGVVRAMIAAHPYEEVAYDVYAVRANPGAEGVARVGAFDAPRTAREVAASLKTILGVERVVGAGPLDKPVSRAAVSTGGGAFLITRVAGLGDCLYVTSDLRYHDARAAEQRGMPVLDVGHFASEIGFVDLTVRALREALASARGALSVTPLKSERDPMSSL